MLVKIVRNEKSTIEKMIPTDYHLFTNIRNISVSEIMSCPFPKKNRPIMCDDGNGSVRYEFFDCSHDDNICWLTCETFYPNSNDVYITEIIFDSVAYICDDNGRTLEVIRVNEKK